MTIDWPSFTPFAALAGGVLIGAASALYLLISGRMAGITGILAGPLQALALRRPLAPLRPQLLFVVGLLAAPLAWRLFAPLPAATLSASPVVLVAAGLLVGVGTRLANGCTSGHGVCGLARLSLRSLANVLVFMAAGFATVYVVRHVLGG
ncbi:MAG: YeeE/YedE family protein [Rubrivivax sp.]